MSSVSRLRSAHVTASRYLVNFFFFTALPLNHISVTENFSALYVVIRHVQKLEHFPQTESACLGRFHAI